MLDANSLEEEDYEAHVISDNRRALVDTLGVRSSSMGPMGSSDGINEIRRQNENSNKFKRV